VSPPGVDRPAGDDLSQAEARAAEALSGPDYQRLWQRCRAALERNGTVRGSVSLPGATAGELRALSSLLGGRRRVTANPTVSLAALDAALRASGLGLGLVDWLERLAGGPLRDRPAERAAVRARRDAVHAAGRAHRLAAASWFGPWLDEIDRSGLLRRLAPGSERQLLDATLAVLDQLPADDVALPVLAATRSGDAKVLSHGVLGTVVLSALAAWSGTERPATAQQRRALWRRHGVRWDDVSSHVLVLGLVPDESAGPGSDAARLAGWLREAAEAGEPFRATVRQLAGGLSFRPGTTLFVCENPAVVVEAANRFGPGAAPLVCTDGMPGDAFWRLAELAVEGGCELRYHGDFDWPGLRIARAVIERCGAVPWRFGVQDYLAGLALLPQASRRGDGAGPAAGLDTPRLAGRDAPSPWDPPLAPAMAAHGLAVHEEVVVDTLLADLGR